LKQIEELTDSEQKLYIVYLINDALHHSLKSRVEPLVLDPLSEALKKKLLYILRHAVKDSPKALDRIMKVVHLWEERQLFSPHTVSMIERGLQSEDTPSSPLSPSPPPTTPPQHPSDFPSFSSFEQSASPLQPWAQPYPWNTQQYLNDQDEGIASSSLDSHLEASLQEFYNLNKETLEDKHQHFNQSSTSHHSQQTKRSWSPSSDINYDELTKPGDTINYDYHQQYNEEQSNSPQAKKKKTKPT